MWNLAASSSKSTRSKSAISTSDFLGRPADRVHSRQGFILRDAWPGFRPAQECVITDVSKRKSAFRVSQRRTCDSRGRLLVVTLLAIPNSEFHVSILPRGSADLVPFGPVASQPLGG
jgi:hypothetical protein